MSRRRLFLSIYRMFFLIFFLMSAAAMAKDQKREFAFFLGGGVGKSFAKLQKDNSTSSFEGWSPIAEAGFDIPFTDRFGFSIAGSWQQNDLLNISSGSKFIEKAEGTTTSAKAGFFFSGFGLGYGIGNESLKIQQISVDNGSTQSSIEGKSSFGYLSYSADIDEVFRVAFEGQHRTGDLDGYTYTDTTVFMKFYFLLGF